MACNDMNFKGVRPFYREISSLLVSMISRVNNIMFLNTPARARLMNERTDSLYGPRYHIANITYGDGEFLEGKSGKKNSERFSSLINLPSPVPLLSLNPLVSNIRKVYARKFSKETAISPHRRRNHCLRSNVYGNTHCIEIEDAMSDPARTHSRSAPGYASNFRRCGCRAHSREENTDKIRNPIYTRGSRLRNSFGVPSVCEFSGRK